MNRIYEYPGIENGESKRKVVILHCSDGCDIDHVLHDVALECCLAKGRKRLPHNNGEVTFGQLMDNAAPELFEKYGVTVIWPGTNAIQVDQDALILSRYELETYNRILENTYQEFNLLRDIASRYTRKLYTLGKQGHSKVLSWDPSRIPAKGIEWAFKALKQGIYATPKIDEFFEQKIQEMKSGKYVGEEWEHISAIGASDDSDSNQ